MNYLSNPISWKFISICTTLCCITIVTQIIVGNACTPAQSAEAVQIQQVVLADIEQGKSIVQIELDVTNLLVSANIQKTADEIVVIVNDVIVYLLDLGQVPAMYLPKAQEMHKQLTLRLNGVAYHPKSGVSLVDSGLLDDQK